MAIFRVQKMVAACVEVWHVSEQEEEPRLRCALYIRE